MNDIEKTLFIYFIFIGEPPIELENIPIKVKAVND
jgi:hypothetical protein